MDIAHEFFPTGRMSYAVNRYHPNSYNIDNKYSITLNDYLQFSKCLLNKGMIE